MTHFTKVGLNMQLLFKYNTILFQMNKTNYMTVPNQLLQRVSKEDESRIKHFIKFLKAYFKKLTHQTFFADVNRGAIFTIPNISEIF